MFFTTDAKMLQTNRANANEILAYNISEITVENVSRLFSFYAAKRVGSVLQKNAPCNMQLTLYNPASQSRHRKK